jgi:hypothetical protein
MLLVGFLHALPGAAPEQATAPALADRVGADVLDGAQQAISGQGNAGLIGWRCSRMCTETGSRQRGPDVCRFAEAQRVAVLIDPVEGFAQFRESFRTEGAQGDLASRDAEHAALRGKPARRRTTAR